MPSSTGIPKVGRVLRAASGLWLSRPGCISQETTPQYLPSQLTIWIRATRSATSHSPVGSVGAMPGATAGWPVAAVLTAMKPIARRPRMVARRGRRSCKRGAGSMRFFLGQRANALRPPGFIGEPAKIINRNGPKDGPRFQTSAMIARARWNPGRRCGRTADCRCGAAGGEFSARSLAVRFEHLEANLAQLLAVLLQTGQHGEGVGKIFLTELCRVRGAGGLLLRRAAEQIALLRHAVLRIGDG